MDTFSPTDNATGVSATANLVLTFNEAVDAEAGADNDITIKTTVGDTTIETIDAQDAKVTGTGTTTITINPDATLSSLTEYYVLIGADAFDDAASNSYAGIAGTTTWSFTTADSGGDSTPPVRSNGAPSGALSSGTTSTNLTLDTNESATCKYDTDSGVAYASMDTTFTTTGSTSHSSNVSVSAGNSYTYYVRCTDASTNANTDDYTISFSVAAASAPASPPPGAVLLPMIPQIIPVFTPPPISVLPAPEEIPTSETPSLVENIAESIKNIFTPDKPAEEPAEIPVAELIPEETPLAFQNRWQLLPRAEINRFVLAPLPRAITNLAQKFPELGKTFEEVGITKITDVAKLQNAKLTLPGLTQRLVGDTPGQFGLPKGVPVAELSDAMKDKIPTEIVFAKGGSGLIDYNMSLSVSEEGVPEQKIATVSGKSLRLVVKPGSDVKSVKGYVVWKRKIRSDNTSLELPADTLLGSIVFGSKVFAQVQDKPVRVEEKLVLLEFEYTDPDGDGIYTAEIQAPVVEGEYEIITVLEFNDPELGRKEIRLTTVVDPEGYVYEKYGDKEIRVPGAIASIYWLDQGEDQYVLWPADEYQQENPQITNLTGTYSFLVPEGYYYLGVEAPGYLSYQGKPFQVTEGSGVHMNIELKTKYWWLHVIDWKTVLLLLVVFWMMYNFYRDKIRGKLINK